MKKIIFCLISLFFVCYCHPKETKKYLQNEPIDFENGLSVIVEEANILPTHLYTYNESINGKLSNSKRVHNTTVNDKYLFLEIVLEVKNTSSESLFVQDLLDFIIEENEVLYSGMLVEEGWKDGYLWLPSESKATYIEPDDSRKMRIYFWMPEEILNSNLILKEDLNNIQITLDISPITSNWIELKKGDSIETDEYSLIIDDIITRESHIQSDMILTFNGLEVTVVNKGKKALSANGVVQKTFGYSTDKTVDIAEIYLLTNLADIITQDDVDSIHGKILPNEEMTFIFGYNNLISTEGFVFLKNQNIYYLPIEN